MTIVVQNDPIQLICEVCAEYLPEDLSVQIHFSPIKTESGEEADMALMTDGEKGYFILVNDTASFEDIPHMIASQVAVILAHLEGAECKSGTETWQRHMEAIRTTWTERVNSAEVKSKTLVVH